MNRSAHLLRELVVRELVARYRGSALGFLWSFVEPLWQLAILTFAFSVVLQVRLPGDSPTPYWAFLLAGLLPWMAVQQGIARSVTSITQHRGLLRGHRFPPALLVGEVVIVELVHQGIALAVFLVALAATGYLVAARVPLLVLAVPLQAGLMLGLGLLAATAQVYVRDVKHATGLLLGAWFYATPIVYPLEMVPSGLRPWIEGNPLTGLVGLYRTALLGAPPPGQPIAATVAGSLLAVAIGAAVFRRLQPWFVDEV